jgi:hypothetical protein
LSVILSLLIFGLIIGSFGVNILSMNFIDLFEGAGGLLEGFIKVGFSPIAHVEMNKDSSY